jgi:type VI secretion system protein ImpA
MKRTVDIDAILAPIPGEDPSGEDLRYTPVYDDIREARRADDPLDMGDWQREIKSSDWEKVFTLTLDALEKKSKDLQIAAWLAESLVMIEGFSGLDKGLRVIAGLLGIFWDTLYPEVEEGDLEYRIAPFEFLNDRLSSTIRQVPLTEPGATAGYSLLKWRESREVGSEAETKNKYGDVDEQKKKKRDELLAEGRIPAEEFDAAVARTSPPFFRSLADDLALCRDAFNALDAIVDEKFGNDAPRLSELGEAIEECERLVGRFSPVESAVKSDKKPLQPAAPSKPAATVDTAAAVEKPVAAATKSTVSELADSPTLTIPTPKPVAETQTQEEVWEEAQRRMQEGKFREALDWLLSISNSQPSERGRNRYRFLVAKLCLKAERPDLALPIVEQLHAMIAELQLERWESPLWIAEVLEALYQCLMSGEPSDEDKSRGNELFRRICTTDVTKALVYRK